MHHHIRPRLLHVHKLLADALPIQILQKLLFKKHNQYLLIRPRELQHHIPYICLVDAFPRKFVLVLSRITPDDRTAIAIFRPFAADDLVVTAE